MLQKTAVKDLKVGMFVADLDRPWMDTPFLLQGFILENAQQIGEVRAHCQWVLIDPLRSTGPEFEQKAKPKEPAQKRDLGTDPIVVVNRTAAPRPLTIEELRAANRAQAGVGKTKPSGSRGESGGTTSAQPAQERSKSGEFISPIAQRDPKRPGSAPQGGASLTPARASLGRKTQSNESGGIRSLFGQLKQDVKSLFSSAPNDEPDYEQYAPETSASPPMERPTFVPETVQLTIYEDNLPVESELGAATTAFTKTQELLYRVVEDIRAGNQMQMQVVETVIEDMVESMVRNPDAMMWVARMREQSTVAYDHGLSVAINLVAFGRHLGFPKEQLGYLGVMGLLLDIGKIRIPREMLEKNTSLTPEEFKEMKRHVLYSMEILQQTPSVNADVAEGVAQHHERMDGSGYPYGLAGNNISIYGKMSAIADTYAAITKKRPYADPASPHDALQMLSNWSGTLFQADMVEHFIQSIGVFPVGSLVELSTGEVAVIVSHNKQRRLRPKVLVVTDPDKTLRKHPSVKDLIYDVSENPISIKRGLPSNAFGIDPSEYYLT